MTLQGEVDSGIKQRMTGADKSGERLTWRRHQFLLKCDTLVTRKHGLPNADQTIAISNWSRHICNFETVLLSLLCCSTEPLKRLDEERFDIVGLQTARLCP